MSLIFAIPRRPNSFKMKKFRYISGAIVTITLVIAIYYLWHPHSTENSTSSATLPNAPSSTTRFGSPSTVASATQKIHNADNLTNTQARRLSFQREDDLWGFAVRRLKDADFSSAYEAADAVRECVGLLNLSNEYLNFSSGVPSALFSGTVSPDRQKAFYTVRSRCKGFFDAGKPKSYELAAAIRARLRGELKPATVGQFSEESGLSTVDRETLALLYSQSSSAVLEGLNRLSLRLANPAEQNQSPVPENYHALLFAASKDISCDLAAGCGKEDFTTLIDCVLHGRCDANTTASNFSREDLDKIQLYKKRLVEAIQRQTVAEILKSGSL